MKLEPQKETTIDVDVGLHHASPPLSYCGKSPWWISCEYCGRPRSLCAVIVVALGNLFFWLVRFIATAFSRVSVGVALDPARRKSVTFSR
jgi:hypothetical protein